MGFQRDEGIWFPGKGRRAPLESIVVGSYTTPTSAKSPFFIAAVGTVNVEEAAAYTRIRCTFTKKNVEFLARVSGPPRVKPKSFSRNGARFRPLRLSKKLLAFSFSLRRNS